MLGLEPFHYMVNIGQASLLRQQGVFFFFFLGDLRLEPPNKGQCEWAWLQKSLQQPTFKKFLFIFTYQLKFPLPPPSPQPTLYPLLRKVKASPGKSAKSVPSLR